MSSNPLRPPVLRSSPLARLISAAALGITLGTCGQAMAAPVRVDIPAQPLSSALITLGQQANLQIVFNQSQVQNLRSTPISGEMEPRDALNTLLQNSGIRYQVSGDQVTLLAAIDAGDTINLPTQTIQRSQAQTSETEGQNTYVPKYSTSGSKTETPIIETPQSISVVTRKQMDDQGAKTVTEALRYVPGVKVEGYGVDPKGFDWLYIRGFNGQATSDYKDGLRQQSNDYALFRTESYGVDRIDVVRGPSSTLFGQGDAGGVINRVMKKPEADHVNEVQVEGGNFDRKQGQFDLGGSLDPENKYMWRVVGLARNSNTQLEYSDGHEVKDDRLYIAPSFTWTPNDDTSLTLLGSVLQDRNGGSAFVYSTPNGHASNTLLGDHSFNHFDQDQYDVGYEFKHRFNDTWQFRQNLRYGQVDVKFNNLRPALFVTPTLVARTADRFEDHLDTFNVDNQFQADFNTGSIKHTVLMGVDYAWQDVDASRYSNLGPFLDINNPVYGVSIPRPSEENFNVGLLPTQRPPISYNQSMSQLGGYLQDQIKFDENWLLTLGGRYDYVHTNLDNNITASASQNAVANDFTGHIGLTYLTSFGLAPYVSYAESFLPNSGVANGGSPFEPSEAKQWEAGIKYQPTDDVLMTLAAFEITKSNVLTAEVINGVSTGFSTAQGEVKSHGIEAEIKARLNENWDVLASYTYDQVKITKSNNGDEGNRPFNVPKQMASGWVNYSFHSGVLDGLSLGGGARYTGSLYGDNANTYHIDAYTLFDAGASYKLSKNVTLGLNAQNLLNETYVASCDDINSCYPGMKRTVVGSAKYSW